MKSLRLVSPALLLCWTALACSGALEGDEDGAASGGGSSSDSGGMTSVGGTTSSGGASSDATGGAGDGTFGGAFSTGGAESTGGADGTGGESDGSGGTGGTGGDAGSGDACPSELVGWATIAGDGVSATTGGGNATPVRPSTVQELLTYASDSTPRVIEIVGTFDVPRLDVKSNKTLVGIGNDATINGGIRIRGTKSEAVRNVIVRNLRVNGATTDVDDDAMQIYFAHHVWIDHCEIWDGPDGNLDMTHAVNWVTVSWTKFRYTTNYKRPSGESSDHRFSSLIGHSDGNASEDEGRLKVTFHHNWWGERVIERMPRVRYGQVHVFNNYFASPNNNYCVRAGRNASLLIEGNYFDGVKSPHEFNNSTDQTTAHITARNNVYHNVSGNQATGGGGQAFTSYPYSATIESASGIPELVTRCAGPRP